MFISHKHKFIFVHVPKAAGTTITEMFKNSHKLTGEKRLDPVPKIHHRGIEEILDKLPQCESYFKFAVVRNPFSRLVSGYTEFKYDEHRENSSGNWPWPTNMSQYNNFTEFCKDLPTSEWISDPHFVSQTSLLYKGENLAVDYVARQENLYNDLRVIADKIAVSDEYLKEHLKLRSRQTGGRFYKGHWSQQYNIETKRIIESVYQEDFKNFGYRCEE